MNYKTEYSNLLKEHYRFRLIFFIYFLLVISYQTADSLEFLGKWMIFVFSVYFLWKSVKGLWQAYFPKEVLNYG